MMYITSAAGARLAKAKLRYDELHAEDRGPFDTETTVACVELVDAADAVADELIASGFADIEVGRA